MASSGGQSAQQIGQPSQPAQSSSQRSVQQEEHHSMCTWILYSIVSFGAYWFGAAQFDYDGDGDFDIEDVEVMFGIKEKKSPRKKTSQKNIAANPKAEAKKPQEKAPMTAGQGGHGEDGGGVGGIVSHGLMGMLDRDGDGEINFLEDLVEADVEGEDLDGDGEIDTAEKKMLKHWPIFIIVQCLVALAFWLIFSFVECESNKNGFCYNGWFLAKAGLDSLSPRDTDLRITDTSSCSDNRYQVWRWLTYQFTHVGVGHICMNIFLTVVVGLPLNGFHGNWRMPLMFNISVFGGAMGWAVWDVHSPTVGMSGGCYGLLGMSCADLIMNWAQKKYRKPHLLMLLLLAGAETLNHQFGHGDGPRPSNAAHVGGVVAGLCIGTMVGKNMKWTLAEKGILVFAIVLGVGCSGFCMGWTFGNWPPRSIWEETGWCWLRQVSNSTNFGTINYQCVMCGQEECINAWSAMPYTAEVSRYLCDSAMGGFQKGIDYMPL